MLSGTRSMPVLQVLIIIISSSSSITKALIKVTLSQL